MKKFVFATALALTISAAAVPQVSASGGNGFQICLGLGWNKWNPCGGAGGGCGNGSAPCFPCIDPALLGLPGASGYVNNVGYVSPYCYGYPQMGAPMGGQAPMQNTYAMPQWSNPTSYQPVGHYAPQGYFQAPSYWYGR